MQKQRINNSCNNSSSMGDNGDIIRSGLECPAGKLHSNEEHIPDDGAWSDLWCASSVCDHRWHTDMSFSLSFSTHMIAHGLKRRRRRKQNKQKNDAISRAICLKRFTHGATLSIIYCAAGGLFTAHMLLCYATNCHILCVCVYWCCARWEVGTSSSSSWWDRNWSRPICLSSQSSIVCVVKINESIIERETTFPWLPWSSF